MTRRIVAFAAVLLTAVPAAAENWPQWRGPRNDGVSSETGLPTTWSADKNIAWKLPLPGMGSSTPAVWGDKIFLTCEDGAENVLICVSTAGKQLWKKSIGKGNSRARKDEGNESSPSPTTDGKFVWAMAGSGDLVCFDMDGREAWRLNLQEKYGKFRWDFGMHTTPVLDGDRIYLPLIHSGTAKRFQGGALIVALDKATGKEAWQTVRPSDGRAECEQSYASPMIWRKGDRGLLIVHGNDYTTAHNLDDGAEVWRVGALNPKDKYNPTLRFVTSPLATPDLVVVPTAKNGPVVGVKPDAKGAVLPGSPSEQWRRKDNTPDVPSPLIVDGLLYLCRENGNLICMDAKTGEEFYNERTHNARHRASPVYADGKVYLTSRDGVVTVVKAGKKFERLAENRLPDQIAASPAISGGRIYLHGWEALYAISEGGK